MSLSSYVTLGRSGLRVSKFCLGTMTFGEDWGFGSNPQESEAILARFQELGGNFVDTANVYTKGHAEKIIGDYFAKKKNLRDRTVIATKFFGNLYPGDPNGGGASRKAISDQCEQSLRRLQTDYIDLYWLHNWDKYTPVEETIRTLDDLVKAGKVRYIGFSDTPAWKVAQAQTLAELRGWSPLVAIQVEYSLLQRTVEGELIPMAMEMGLGVMPWSPLRNGVLSGKYSRENQGKAQSGRSTMMEDLTEKDFIVIDRLKEIANEIGSSPAGVALAWVQAQPGVSSTLIGARRMDQLEANLKALDLKLSDEHIASLNELTKPNLNFPYDFNKNSPSLAHGGATVNGEKTMLFPLVPVSDEERY